MGELIAVLSGKGGTGKTSVCAGIATALAAANRRVLCIDCDVGLRNLDISLGLSDTASLSFLEVCRVPAHLVINRLRPRLICQGKLPDVDEIMDTAGVRLLGLVPEDEQVAVSCAYGKPLPEDSAATVCFDNIARRLMGEDVSLAPLEKLVKA